MKHQNPNSIRYQIVLSEVCLIRFDLIEIFKDIFAYHKFYKLLEIWKGKENINEQ